MEGSLILIINIVVMVLLPVIGWWIGSDRALDHYKRILNPEVWAYRKLSKNPILFASLPRKFSNIIDYTGFTLPTLYAVVAMVLVVWVNAYLFSKDVFWFSIPILASMPFWLIGIWGLIRWYKKKTGAYPSTAELEKRLKTYLETHEAEILTHALKKKEHLFAQKLSFSSTDAERYWSAKVILSYGTDEQIVDYLRIMLRDFNVYLRLMALPYIDKLNANVQEAVLAESFRDIMDLRYSVISKDLFLPDTNVPQKELLNGIIMYQLSLFEGYLGNAHSSRSILENMQASNHVINVRAANYLHTNWNVIKEYIRKEDFPRLIQLFMQSESVILHQIALKWMTEQASNTLHIAYLPEWIKIGNSNSHSIELQSRHKSKSWDSWDSVDDHDMNIDRIITKDHHFRLQNEIIRYVYALYHQEEFGNKYVFKGVASRFLCGSCLMFSQKLTFRDVIVPVCRNCGSAEPLIHNYPNPHTIGVIGGMKESLHCDDNGNIFIKCWDDRAKKTVYADIIDLEIRYEGGISYDWAINAVTQQMINSNMKIQKLTIDPRVEISPNSKSQLKEIVTR